MKKIVEKNDELKFYGIKVLKVLLFLLFVIAIYSIILINKQLRLTNILITILSVISPLFIGVLIAYLLNPLITSMSKSKMNRFIATAIVYLIILGILYLSCSYLFPSLGKELSELFKYIPNVLNNISKVASGLFKKLNLSEEVSKSIVSSIKDFSTGYMLKLTKEVPEHAITIATSIVTKIGTILISLIISFYLLIDFDKATENIYVFVPRRYRENVHKLLSTISEQLFSFVKGTGLIAILVFIVSCVAFMVSGLKGAVFFALWNAITNIIPYIGPWIGGIPIVVFAFSTDFRLGIIVLIIVIIIQILESYILHPIVMSKTMKLHPVTIIIGLLIFGHFFGIIGMLLATPITAILKTIALYLNEKYKLIDRLKIK
ncbi:MAG: AI-2E family transporter [Bacilli bacterium]|nr:AI-2E family transporter [Bacilli bacterium]